MLDKRLYNEPFYINYCINKHKEYTKNPILSLKTKNTWTTALLVFQHKDKNHHVAKTKIINKKLYK